MEISSRGIVIARRLFQPTKQSFWQESLAGKIASSFLLSNSDRTNGAVYGSEGSPCFQCLRGKNLIQIKLITLNFHRIRSRNNRHDHNSDHNSQNNL